ncbi:transposase [Staphylococcus aureus]
MKKYEKRKRLFASSPNQTSANRLIGAVLMDLHDEWILFFKKIHQF